MSQPVRGISEEMRLSADPLGCTDMTRHGTCKCGLKCSVCGHGEHMAVHMAPSGLPRTAHPFGHYFTVESAE